MRHGLIPHYYQNRIECGCDEAGRGCLAGSVYAAAVILPQDYDNPELDDSKKLSPEKRYDLRIRIQEEALAWAVGIVTPEEIDRINILHASFLAMHRAIDRLKVLPQVLIIDGNHFDPYYPLEKDGARSAVALPFSTMVKGDGTYQAIAAASILAKTYRDEEMVRLDKLYPEYHWRDNKGYPTAEHCRAILKYGITGYHRKSYHFHGEALSDSDLKRNGRSLCGK